MRHPFNAVRGILLAMAMVVLPGCSSEQLDTAETPEGLAELAATPGTGNFLHLSDIHFDPFADPALVKQLNDEPIDKWEGILDSSSDQTIHSGRHIDSNWFLFKSALKAAADAGKTTPYDYVLYTGDYLAHNFNSSGPPGIITDREAFAVKTVNFVNAKLEETFGVPIVSALGNNDSAVGDYQLIPDGPFLDGISGSMPGIGDGTPRQAQFKTGGYYRIPHPTIKNHDFLVLSIFWSRDYDYQCDAGTALTPGINQFSWLIDALSSDNKPITVLMHIPPGIDGYSGYDAHRHRWKSIKTMWCGTGNFESQFEAALGDVNVRDRIKGGFAGHTHMDEFRVLSDASGPYLALRMAPSISPSNGNRPAFSVAQYDRTSGVMTDYTVIALTNVASHPTDAQADWQTSYTFSSAYGVSDYSPATMAKLATSIRTHGSKDKTTFGDNYASGASTPAARSWDTKYFACALNETTVSAYKACTN